MKEPDGEITKEKRQGGFCKASNSVYREVTHIHICGGIMKSNLFW